MTDLEIRLNELESRKESRLKIINDEYYDSTSPHYKDNERFSWAVDTLNRNFDEEKWEIMDEEFSKPKEFTMTIEEVIERFDMTKEEIKKLLI